ncbi:hypothetical protein LR48_Vigan06g080900 [Vigna angularis]|uniref:Uncharacterized protein n=1 Tax=Phaseolus angularis TaxID=3914 RepID=A0A0L9URY8_PHAAN|nr:hypothetical protein LR48_Vigan06g080900 [Vigna angularis]
MPSAVVPLPPLRHRTATTVPSPSPDSQCRAAAASPTPLPCRRHHHAATSVHLLDSRNPIANRDSAMDAINESTLSFIAQPFFFLARGNHLAATKTAIVNTPPPSSSCKAPLKSSPKPPQERPLQRLNHAPFFSHTTRNRRTSHRDLRHHPLSSPQLLHGSHLEAVLHHQHPDASSSRCHTARPPQSSSSPP